MKKYWYIASYPKSGNTWCRIFISELIRISKLDIQDNAFSNKNFSFNNWNEINKGDIFSSYKLIEDHLGIDISDLSFDELQNLRSKIKELKIPYLNNYPFIKIHDSFFGKDQENSIIPTINCGGAVYIVRHPADVAISLSQFKTISLEESIRFLINCDSALCDSETKGYSQAYQFLGSWGYHVKTWHLQKHIPIITVRYEDMINKTYDEFYKIASFLGISSDEKLIKNAIKLADFSRLKSMEQKFGFLEASSEKIPFFRKGTIGDGLKKLKTSQLNLLERKFKSTLLKLGYDLKTF